MISEWIKSKFQLNPPPVQKPARKTEYMYMGDGMMEEVYVDEPSTYELDGQNYHGRRETQTVQTAPIIAATSFDGGSYDSGSCSCSSTSCD